jgi:hypothetical protein
MPGYDPILDGTAAPYVEFKVRQHRDGTWETTFPDGTTGLYATATELAKATASWVADPEGGHRGA